ncbi:MAG: DUF2569 domain-containing protein [Thermodesulfobacteriota bacterium]
MDDSKEEFTEDLAVETTIKPKKKIKGEEEGLGGWLLIPGIWLIIDPILNLHSLYMDYYIPFFREGYWEVYTSPDSAAYHHLIAPLLTFEISFTLIFITFDLFLIYFFLKKSYRLPKLIIIFYITNLIYGISDIYLANMIPEIAAAADKATEIRDIGKSVIYTIVWVSYFLTSKRVKNTFVRGKPKGVFKMSETDFDIENKPLG